MSGWEVGDLALCIIATGERRKYAPGAPPIRRGGIYVVEGVTYPNGICGLIIKGHPSSSAMGSFLASAFRKVTPPAEDEFDRETIELMNRAPAKEPVA